MSTLYANLLEHYMFGGNACAHVSVCFWVQPAYNSYALISWQKYCLCNFLFPSFTLSLLDSLCHSPFIPSSPPLLLAVGDMSVVLWDPPM